MFCFCTLKLPLDCTRFIYKTVQVCNINSYRSASLWSLHRFTACTIVFSVEINDTSKVRTRKRKPRIEHHRLIGATADSLDLISRKAGVRMADSQVCLENVSNLFKSDRQPVLSDSIITVKKWKWSFQKITLVLSYRVTLFKNLSFKNSLVIHKLIDLSTCWSYIMCSDFISINLILISMWCFIRYKDTAREHATDTTNGGYTFNLVSTNLSHSKFTHNAMSVS